MARPKKTQANPSGSGKSRPRPPRKPAARPRGRPKADERVFGPGELELLAEMHLRKVSLVEMAQHFGVDVTTIRDHIARHVTPVFESHLASRLGRTIAEVDLISKYAWDRFMASQKPRTRREIRKELKSEGVGDGKLGEGISSQTISRVLAKVEHVGESCWLNIVCWCVDWLSKVGNYYKAGQREASSGEGFRVAGRSPAEVDEAMLQRLIDGVRRRAEYAQAVAAWGRRN